MGNWPKEFPWKFLTESRLLLLLRVQIFCSTGFWGAPVGSGCLETLHSVLSVLHVARSPLLVWLHSLTTMTEGEFMTWKWQEIFCLCGLFQFWGRGTPRAWASLRVHWVAQQCLHFSFAFLSPSKIFDHVYCARYWARRINALDN